jgi:hypothetical protein
MLRGRIKLWNDYSDLQFVGAHVVVKPRRVEAVRSAVAVNLKLIEITNVPLHANSFSPLGAAIELNITISKIPC